MHINTILISRYFYLAIGLLVIFSPITKATPMTACGLTPFFVDIVAVSSTDINMSGNVFSNIYKGILYFYSTGVYTNTKYVNTQIPYTGGTNGGGNQ